MILSPIGLIANSGIRIKSSRLVERKKNTHLQSDNMQPCVITVQRLEPGTLDNFFGRRFYDKFL